MYKYTVGRLRPGLVAPLAIGDPFITQSYSQEFYVDISKTFLAALMSAMTV